MAASVDSPHLKKESSRLNVLVSSPLFSPGSDKRFWSSLRHRVDVILEKKQAEETSCGKDNLNLDSLLANHGTVGKSDGAKRMKEDSQLLLRGFDSIAQTLSLLSNNLDNALQGARHLAEPPTMSEIFHSNLRSISETQQDELRKAESNEKEDKDKNKGVKRKFDPIDSSDEQENHLQKENEQIPKDKKLKRAKNIAISMATKAASLARELKSMKSDLCFVQERCALLEEENRRLRDGFDKGIRPEEDDLMRLQMEALLAEKSRLANENTNLVRENQCLHQLVEYHQITSQDLSASYEEILRGTCLDFSSPILKAENEDDDDEDQVAETRQTSIFGFATSLDESFQEEQKNETSE